MNYYTLVKLVVAIARQGADRQDGCKANCPTGISAQRR
jgi:hypothetical protein